MALFYCGPAAGAMIANYYKYVKGYKLRGKGSYSNSNANLINYLYFEMNSYALGTNHIQFQMFSTTLKP